eukprot:scaffold174473_cov44-Tisochrysis_lutea.AAC.1
MLVPAQHADIAAEMTAVDPELGMDAFLRDFADWLHLQSHGRMPGITGQLQLPGQDKAALMFEVGQDLLLSAQSWDMPALGRLLHAGLAEQEPLRT